MPFLRALLSVASAVAVAALAVGCSDSSPSDTTDAGVPPSPSGAPAPGMPGSLDGGAEAGHTPGPIQPPGGVLLDAHGGLHPFGGLHLDTTSAPSWPTTDTARALVVLPDGSGGWVLDGTGGIHAFGQAPPVTAPSFAQNKDVARALVVLPDMQSGYVLDDLGGLHAFGPHAPVLSGTPTFTSDIARGLDVHLDPTGKPDGGWVLDGWGGLHPFGAAPMLAAPPYYKGYDLWYKLHVVPGGAYVIGRWGIVDRVGTPGGVPLTGLPDYKDQDIVRDIVPVNPTATWDTSRELTCPGAGTYCGADGIPGSTSVLYSCTGSTGAPSVDVCAQGCKVMPSGTPDYCTGVLSCSHLQWWNTYITYGPYQSYGWWDTDLGVSSSTPVQLRHDSKLTKTGVYAWGYMPEFVDLVTGKNFRFLHLRPQHQYATNVGQVYPAGTIVGLSGGDTADTGYPTYSTGAHLCVQTLDLYRTCFPEGKDPCQ